MEHNVALLGDLKNAGKSFSWLLILSLCAGFALNVFSQEHSNGLKPAGDVQPNIIIILADDLGFGDLGCYGAKLIKTPNLDRLAAQGMRFTDVHTSASVCSASRYALLTGRYHWRDGVRPICGSFTPLTIDRKRKNLPRIFKDRGYATAAIGKWHLGFGENEPDYNGELTPGPLDIGFDEFFGYPVTNHNWPEVYIYNRRVFNLDPADPFVISKLPNGRWRATGGKAAQWVDEEMGDVFAGRAVAWIEQNKGRPFFLYFASQYPHAPQVPHPRYRGTSQAGLRGDCIQEFDGTVGLIMETLERLDLQEKTLVIVTSDNGGSLKDNVKQDPVCVSCGHEPNAPWNGYKYDLFEGGHRVPFIARWPGHVPAKAVSRELFGLVDMPASMAVLLGKTPPPEAVDSLSALSALLAEKPAPPVRSWHISGNHAELLCLRLNQWKYIEKGKSGSLFNLSDDAGESRNVANEQSVVKANMEEILKNERVRTPSFQ